MKKYTKKQRLAADFRILRNKLCPWTWDRVGNFPPSTRARFAGGAFFIQHSSVNGSSIAVYAKTKTGIVWRWYKRERAWVRVVGQ